MSVNWLQTPGDVQLSAEKTEKICCWLFLIITSALLLLVRQWLLCLRLNYFSQIIRLSSSDPDDGFFSLINNHSKVRFILGNNTGVKNTRRTKALSSAAQTTAVQAAVISAH